jgi:hypothetical protein
VLVAGKGGLIDSQIVTPNDDVSVNFVVGGVS